MFHPRGLTVVPPPCAKNRSAEISPVFSDRGILLNRGSVAEQTKILKVKGFFLSTVWFQSQIADSCFTICAVRITGL